MDQYEFKSANDLLNSEAFNKPEYDSFKNLFGNASSSSISIFWDDIEGDIKAVKDKNKLESLNIEKRLEKRESMARVFCKNIISDKDSPATIEYKI